MNAADGLSRAWRRLVSAWDRLAVYLPVILMGVVALGTYLLARNTPVFGPPAAARPASHDPDYFLRGFSLKSFDARGQLKSEVRGVEGRHYPDTDTLEIDEPRLRSFSPRGDVIIGSARRALAKGDGSELQLLGDAVVTREAGNDAAGRRRPRMEIRGEFLHVFVNAEILRSNKPVVLQRGADLFTADSLDYQHGSQQLALQGRVRGVIEPDPRRPGAR